MLGRNNEKLTGERVRERHVDCHMVGDLEVAQVRLGNEADLFDIGFLVHRNQHRLVELLFIPHKCQNEVFDRVVYQTHQRKAAHDAFGELEKRLGDNRREKETEQDNAENDDQYAKAGKVKRLLVGDIYLNRQDIVEVFDAGPDNKQGRI
jgi:hypothetical protein